MKKTYLLYAILLLCINSVSAQSLHINYTRMIGGNGYEDCNDALYDARDKSIVFTGYTEDSCGTGDLPPCPVFHGERDLLVGKLDSNRNIAWIKQYGGSRSDATAGIITTEDSGYALVGGSDSYDGDVNGNHGGGGSDVWFLKLDKHGDLEWQKCYGSNYSEGAGRLLQTKDKGYIIMGGSNGSGGDVPFQYVNSQFAIDWFIIKTDSVGHIIWTKTMGGTGYEYDASIFVINNKYYIIGSSDSHDHECNDSSWHKGINTEDDYFLICLDSAGNYLWNKSYGGSYSDRVEDALFDERDSTFVITGYTTSIDYMVPTATTPRNDLWIIKVDLQGKMVWNKICGDNSSEWHSRIHKSNIYDGYIIACQAILNSPIPPYYYGTNTNVRLFLIDSSGNEIISKVIGGTVDDYNGIPVLCDDNFVIAGTTSSAKFEEGTTSSAPLFQNVYVSYLDYWSTGIKNNVETLQQKVQVYPNPAQNSVYISFSTNVHKGALHIINESGKEIYSEKIKNANNCHIFTAAWPRGIYIIQWQSDKEKGIQKFVLQ